MRWAIAQGYRQDNPAGDAITAALPKRPTPVQHRAALPHHEVAAAVAAARNADAWVGTRLAFEFLVLTAARSAEVRLATWGEMDLVAMVWTVSGRRKALDPSGFRSGHLLRGLVRAPRRLQVPGMRDARRTLTCKRSADGQERTSRRRIAAGS